MQIVRNLPFSGNIFLHLRFLPYQTWPCHIVADSGRHTAHTVCEKSVSIMNLAKSRPKYRSMFTDHDLKNLLVLVTSSVNPNIE